MRKEKEMNKTIKQNKKIGLPTLLIGISASIEMGCLIIFAIEMWVRFYYLGGLQSK